jgi:hypothetical protein
VIEVIDPTHPLFGQRFSVLSLARRPGRPGLVTVAYGDDARLRIPLSVTNRADCLSSRPRTKITPEVIRELVTLVEEFTGSWRDKRRPSGRGYPKR